MAKNSKGLNKEKVDKVMQPVEEIIERFVDEVDEPTVESTVEEIVEEIVQPIVEQTPNKFENVIEQHEHIKLLNYNIKGAIHYNKDKSTKGVLGTQYKTILKAYEYATGLEMNEVQREYMKTLNFEQAKSVLHTINMFNKKFNSSKAMS